MLRVTSSSDLIFNTPAIIHDWLFVRLADTRGRVAVDCVHIRDVYAVTDAGGSSHCAIELSDGVMVNSCDNAATVRTMWLAWACDNLRFTTEVARGK